MCYESYFVYDFKNPFIVCSPAEDGSEKYLEDEDGSKDDRTG